MIRLAIILRNVLASDAVLLVYTILKEEETLGGWILDFTLFETREIVFICRLK
jgi:hypothetical protein